MSDDDDMGDIWRAHNKERQEKRASNRESSADYLKRLGIDCVSKNGGAHLILKFDSMAIDFWPGTGLWITRGHKHDAKGRGIRGLLKVIEIVTGKQLSFSPTQQN